MRFIGVDPGLVTGLVSFNAQDNETLPLWGIQHWQLDHIAVGVWFDQWKSTNGISHQDTIIAMESFIITPGTAKKTQAPWSLETIGMVRYFVETAGLKLRMSAPSAHKKLITDDVLKRAGLWFPGEGHACDAARVALHVAIVDHKLLKKSLYDEEEL